MTKSTTLPSLYPFFFFLIRKLPLFKVRKPSLLFFFLCSLRIKSTYWVWQVGFRGIENFTVSDFPHLKEAWHNQLLIGYFTNLKSLVVDDKCNNLKYMFTPSLGLGLVQLQELVIKNCVVLEAIIVIVEERTDNTLFPSLTRLELKGLPKLSRFCTFPGNSIELPSLARLWIDNCPNMETFISGSTDADITASKENNLACCNVCITDADIQPFFDEKVLFLSFLFYFFTWNSFPFWNHCF